MDGVHVHAHENFQDIFPYIHIAMKVDARTVT